jgi:hypothetical protein
MQQHKGCGFTGTGAEHPVFEPARSDLDKAVVV